MDELYLKFIQVINSYCDKMPTYKGLKYIGKLSPEDGLRLINDMESIGITFMGVEIWQPYGDWISENYWDDFTIDSDVYSLPNAAQVSAQLCRGYILNDMPSNVKYVSFVFRVPTDWAWEKYVCI